MSLTFPSQAFTVVAVFNSMTFALKVTPLAVRSLSEGAVAVKRFQVRIVDTLVIRSPHHKLPEFPLSNTKMSLPILLN